MDRLWNNNLGRFVYTRNYRPMRFHLVPLKFPIETATLKWLQVTDGWSEQALQACKIETGEVAYIAKVLNLRAQTVTGFTTENAGVAYVPYATTEHVVSNYSVLTTDHMDGFHWQPDNGGHVPKLAVIGGFDRDETLYIGRTCTPLTDGETVYKQRLRLNHTVPEAARPGKIHGTHGCLYVPYNGREYIFRHYEVLCHKTSPGKLTAIYDMNLQRDNLGRFVYTENYRNPRHLLPLNFPIKIASLDWLQVPDKEWPEQALQACTIETGETAYIAKVFYLDSEIVQIINGFTTKHAGVAYVPYARAERRVNKYLVLTTHHKEGFYWQWDCCGLVPKTAVAGGYDRGEPLYIGRTCTPLTDGRTAYKQRLRLNHTVPKAARPGKIHRSHGCLYVPYNGREYKFRHYEVLCHKTSPGKLTAICKWKICNILPAEDQAEAIDKLNVPRAMKEYLISR